VNKKILYALAAAGGAIVLGAIILFIWLSQHKPDLAPVPYF
jgi:hypothetical protein